MVSSGLQSDPSGFPVPALPSHPNKNFGSKKKQDVSGCNDKLEAGYPQTSQWRHGGFIVGYKSLSTKDAVESLVQVFPVQGFAASYVMYCYKLNNFLHYSWMCSVDG